MAISRIGGKALRANLERDSDLAFNTDTLVIDYTNGRIGIGKTNPAVTLDVTGAITASGTIAGAFTGNITGNVTGNSAGIHTGAVTGNVTGNLTGDVTSVGVNSLGQISISGNKIESNVSNADITVIASGTGILDIRSNTKLAGTLIFGSGVDANKILDEDNLVSNDADALATQQSIKAYVDGQISGISTASIVVNDTNVTIADTGSNGTVTTTIDGAVKITTNTAGTTFAHPIAMGTSKITGVGNPTALQDVATKAYVDTQISAGASTGMTIALATPTDGSLTTSGAYLGWTTATKVTDAIDDLNETTENIRNSTFVKSVTFTSDVTAAGSGFTATLSITATGTANQYVIVWGDGTSNTTTASTSPTHTYSNYADSPHSVTVTASNTGGSGTGSSATFTRTDYITVYSPNPVVDFAVYAASSGGSAITQWDDGATVYFQNNSTNADISDSTVQWTWDWGDSESDNVLSADNVAGGTGGARLAHTFTASTETEVSRTVRLTLDTMSTANPAVIPMNTTNVVKIYDTHTPTVALDDVSGVNEEATSGHVVEFTNNTESTIGSQATYGQTYQYQWGDGTSNTNVNVGSGASGDTGGTINHTYALSSSNQSNGTAVDYTGNLRVISEHTSSPFVTSTFSVHVEPDVRTNLAATAITVSDASGDNQYSIYNHTDLAGVNRALVRGTNTSQNADSYVWAWGDGDSDNVTENGSDAGSIGAIIDHDYAGESAGNKTLSLTSSGTPDLTAQTDAESLTIALKAVPSAPASLSAKSITLNDAYDGTLPKLAHGFTDNSTSAPLSAAADLTTTTARRYTSGTIDTSVANDAYKTFSASLNETGTFTSLVVSQQVDYNDIDGSYPSNFYQVFDAKITKALSGYSVGVNDERLEHSTTGNTNYVAVVKDNLTATPTFGSVGALSAGTNGTFRYVSGIPYYNSGSPTVNITGMTINDLVGQAYTNQTNIVEVDSGTNAESTSSNATNANDYSYSDIDGATTMLSSGIPKINTGTSSAYAVGSLSVPITASSVRTVETIKARARNVNGISGYTELSATKIAVHTESQSGVNETAIPVSDSLGDGTYTDDGVRIFDFSASSANTPSFSSSTNYFTNSLYAESADPGVEGTKEATVRLGLLKYDVTDYSSGYLPVGPDRSGDTGTQYFTFAFRRRVVANFDINITGTIAGIWYCSPGTILTAASGLNGWVEATTQYAGVGLPGTDAGNGGNGSSGGAFTGADVVPTGSSINASYTMTLGTANMSNATNNVVMVRIALTSGQSISSLSIGVAA
jgi:hypothetical protein